MLDALVFAAGVLLIIGVLGSSIRTVLLPRGVRTRLGRIIFVGLRIVLKLRIRRSTSYEVRDRVLAYYGPLALLGLLLAWITGVFVGYAAMFWAVGVRPLRATVSMSGSSLVTLGFATPHGLPQTVLAFTEAGLGVVELAMLITFLPNVYGDFHARERDVIKLRVEAANPPWGVNILIRLWRLERLEARTDIWMRWIDWFALVEDSHTSFPALSFFRSSVPEYSWVTASGAILDGAALSASCLDAPRDLEAELCIRSGYLCLRRIAKLLRLPYDSNPRPDDPIAVAREEFDEVWEMMRKAGVPLKDNQDQAWRDFAGWRVNYDEPLIRLATLTEAPIAPWSSDRGLVSGRRMTFIERIRT